MGTVAPFPGNRGEAPRAVETPPHDELSERFIVGGALWSCVRREDGSIAWNRAAFDRAACIVSVEDFYSPALATMWQAVAAITARDGVPDLATLTAELHAVERYNTIGGDAFLRAILDDIRTDAHIEEHARIVAALSRRRTMLHVARGLVRALQSLAGDPFEVRDRAIGALADIDAPNNASTPIGALAAGYVHALEDAYETGAGPLDRDAVTGLADIDHAVRLEPKRLIMLGALPGVGKTALALQAAIETATVRCDPVTEAVVYVTAEDAPDQLRDRALAANTGIAHDMIRRMDLTDAGVRSVRECAERFASLPLYLEACASHQWTEVAGIVTRHARKRRLRLVVIDHLHELRARGHEDERRMVEAIAANARLLAVRYDCPVLLLGALNRKSGNERYYRLPRAADFRETGMIESKADTVILLHSEAKHPTHKRKADEPRDSSEILVLIPKARGGRTGETRVRFRGEIQRFESIVQEPAAQTERDDLDWMYQ